VSENLKAAAYAAGLSDKEKGKVDSLSKLLAVHKELSNLPSELAQRQAGKYTPAQQDSLVKVMGNEDPMTQPSRGWLGSAWHYTGGQVANLGGKVLAGLQNVSDFSTRLYRTGAISLAEGVDLETAWKEANDKGDKKFNPNRIEDARSKFGNEAVDVAMRIASGEKIDEIIKTATPEQQKYLMLADPNRVNIPGYDNKDQEENARGLFQDTLDAVQASKYSPGRQIANLLLPGFLEGSGFAYKAISGSIDAAYRVFADPLLLAGRVKTLNDIRKYSVEVITGSAAKDGVKFNQYFDLPSTKNFWDAYGAKLKDLRKAQDAKDTIAVTQIKKDLSILAPEFGPAVIQSFNKADEPIEDVLTAKGFFLNAKQTGEMMAGSNGRRKVIAPRLTPARQLRVATLTTANQLFNIDKIGNELVNAQFFGEDATDVGIYKALIEGKEQIVQSVQALNKSKKFGSVRFSTADINVRIDNLKRKVSIAPMFKDNELDVIAKDAPDQMYRLARLVLPQRESKLISEAFANTPEIGKRKEMFYGLWSTITDIRGINTTEPTRNIARSMVGKGKMKFGVDDPLDDIGAFATDFNSKVTVPNLVDLDRLTARSTIGQKLIGPVANSAFLEKATGYWSFLTLAGPRYALRNATEDLMVNLAIGSTPWGIATGRRLNTRVLTAMPAKEAKVRDLLNVDTMADSPLGAIMRIVNKDESAKYSTQIAKLDEEIIASKKKISDLYKLTKTSNDPVAIASAKTEIAQLRSKTEGGLVEQTRKILATALSEGRVNRYLDAAGLGKLDDLGIELLGEQIVYGNYEDVLSVISEGGFNFATGGDFLSSAVDTVRQVNSRTAAVRIEGPKKKYTRQAGQVGFKNVRLDGQDEATLVSWLLRISYISNDELGKVAVANLHKKEAAAILEIKKAIQTNPDLVDASILSARGIDIDQHAKLVYDRTKEVFVMSKNGKINEDLLGRVRILDPETGQYVVQGKISLDDLPVSEGDIPKYVVGPSLVPVSDTQNYAATFTQSGWRWLGMANARMSRQPIVTNQMIQIRKQMRKSGFEDAWIKSYTKDIDPNSVGKLEEATKKAKEDLARVVEERSVGEVLAYVDNPLIRTQMAFSIRNFARFYRATEDFYRRISRAVRYNPVAIQKAALTYEGITHSGFIQQDDQGTDYFIYPGITPVYNAVNKVLTTLGLPDEFKSPLPIQFGAQVKMITPSLNPDSLIPTFAGPVAGVSISTLTNLVGIWNPGAADTITRYTLGKYAVDQPVVSAFLPAHINRAYAALNRDERNSQYASAWRKAVTYLEASGNGIPERFDELGNKIPPTAQDLEEYRSKVKNTVIGILGTRFVFGFFAPASPQVQLKSDMAEWVRDNGRSNFKQVWTNLLNQYPGDYDAAMTKWVELFPDQIPFTVTESERNTVAYFRYAEESGQFVNQNKDLFSKYKEGAAFLIPHKGGFSFDAYKTMRDMGLIENKRVEDYLREVQTASSLQQYFEKKDEYERTLQSSGSDYIRRLARQQFNTWKSTFFAGNPLVAEELSQSSQKAIDRQNALNDLENMVTDPEVERISPQTTKALRDMVNLYQSYKNQRQSYDLIGGSTDLIQSVKDSTILRMKELATFNENTQAAYDVLFGRLLGE
jgi:hypothetical protein